MKTILIVDDDENVRVMYERRLADEGYITHSVSSGAEALEFVSKNPQIDLVVLDVKMAPLNGIQVLKRLRAKKVDIPVILHSDYSTYKGEFDAWFADAYVVKSSDLRELKDKIKELLSFEA